MRAVNKASSNTMPISVERHGAQALNREHVLDQTRNKAGENAGAAGNRVDDHPDDGRDKRRRRRHADDAGDQSEDTERPRPSVTSREIDLMA